LEHFLFKGTFQSYATRKSHLRNMMVRLVHLRYGIKTKSPTECFTSPAFRRSSPRLSGRWHWCEEMYTFLTNILSPNAAVSLL